MTEESKKRFCLKAKVKKALLEYEESQIYEISIKQRIEVLSGLYFELLNEVSQEIEQ